MNKEMHDELLEEMFGGLTDRTVPVIQVLYHDDFPGEPLQKIEKFENGDWIDLRAAETVEMKAGEFRLISLGVSMKLPEGYEANIVPRSSTFMKWGILQTNHFGVIDNSYSGENDIWRFPAIALRDTIIHKNDRICQFRIMDHQPQMDFEEVESLGMPDRGGHGSTGIL